MCSRGQRSPESGQNSDPQLQLLHRRRHPPPMSAQNTPHKRPTLPHRQRVPTQNHQKMDRRRNANQPSHNTRRGSSERNSANPPRTGNSRSQHLPDQIKDHRGEPLNEVADSRAEQDRTAHDAEEQDQHTPKILWDLPSGRTIFTWNKNGDPGDDQAPNKKSRTWSNAVRAEIRAAGGRKELEKAIQTTTEKWRKQNFPKGKPPTREGLEVFHGNAWKNKKKWLELILKRHLDVRPTHTETYTHTEPITSTSSCEN